MYKTRSVFNTLKSLLFMGLFLAGFAAPAMAKDDDVTLDLTLAVSKYTGDEGGMVAMSTQFKTDPPQIQPIFCQKVTLTMLSTWRGQSTYNQVLVSARAADGYTFSYWADSDSEQGKPSAAPTDEKTIYKNGATYIKRQLCTNPGSKKTDEGTYYQAYFHYHVYAPVIGFVDEHHDKYTLYAVFEPNPYVVTFKDGETTVSTKDVKFNKVYGTLPAPTKTGYTFDGWFTAATGGTQVHAADKYTTVGNQTLYAHWTEQTYTIHFVDNEFHHTPADATYSVAVGQMPALPATTYLLQEADKYFAGYYTQLNGAGERIYAGYAEDGNLKLLATSKTLTSDITLYAHYSHVHHNMYWDYTYLDAASTADPKPYIHMQKGDNTDRILFARLTFYKADRTESKNVILQTADPDNNTVTPITSDLSTHTTALADIVLSVSATPTVSGSVITKNQETGKHEVYFTDADLADFHSYKFEPIKNDGSSVANQWAATTEKTTHNTILTFNGADPENCFSQSWSVTLSGLLINPDVIYVMPLFAKTFDGEGKPATWAAISQIAHTAGVPCQKTGEDKVNKTATYTGNYLVWKESTYAIGLVGFNLGGQDYWMNTTNPGTFSPLYNSGDPKNGVTVNPGTNPANTTGAISDLTINMTVPASAIPVIRFLANAEDAVLSQNTPNYLVKEYGATVNMADSNYTATRPNYVFQGWKAVGGSSIITELTADKAYTLEAQWEGDAYTVTLDANGGVAGSKTSVTANYGAAMPALQSSELPTYVGHTFTGFWDADDVKYYNADGTNALADGFKKTENITIYAGWTANTYTVTFDLNDAPGVAPAQQTATFGAPLADVTAPTWLGHAFLGFFDGKEANAKKYIDAEGHCIQAWDKASNATLYAHWETEGFTLNAKQDPLHTDLYYTTFYLGGLACQILTDNVTAFVATGASDGKLRLESIDDEEGAASKIIPAGEAVLLRAYSSEIQLVPVELEPAPQKNANNLLQGVDVETAQTALGAGTYYVFSCKNNNVGFYKYNADQTLKANKAFYHPTSGAAERYVLDFGEAGFVTGVERVEQLNQGRKMLIDGRLYIENNGKLYNVRGMLVK